MNQSERMRKLWSDPEFKKKMRQARWGDYEVPVFPTRHPTQTCACGCGELVPLYNQTNPARGIFKGQPAKFVHGHNGRGPSSVQWKGQQINGAGYVRRWLAPGYSEYEHRLVMEEYLGRSLSEDELVHHIDGDKQNNAIENLGLTNRAEHPRLHAGHQAGEYTL